jgi:hypothetical protein
MSARRSLYFHPWLLIVETVLLFLPLFFFSRQHFLRPPRVEEEQVLFQGIKYKRQALSFPRPLMLHLVEIDLTAPGLKVFVTPGKPTEDLTETNARTTSEFLREFKLQLAINASYFYQFREKTPWDYYPYRGDRVNVSGQGISNGEIYSAAETKFPALCFAANNRARIASNGICPPETLHAIAGYHLLLNEGKPVRETSSVSHNLKPYPCVVAAIDKNGTKLWLMAIDGKQPAYSEGVTIAELTAIAKELNAQTAINLDGGGSTTLVMESQGKAKILNAPIHAKVPMNERPVANHLGFFALPSQ